MGGQVVDLWKLNSKWHLLLEQQISRDFRMINRETNSSDQLYQPVTALTKTRNFEWVQRKVSRQTKHFH